MAVQPTTTVFDLQSTVSKFWNVDAMTSVLLFFQGAKLDERATMQAAGVTAGATIQVNYRVGKTLMVTMPDGAMKKVAIDEGETIESLIVKLGHSAHAVSVMLNDEAQEPATTIQSLKLTDGDVLSLTAVVGGGL